MLNRKLLEIIGLWDKKEQKDFQTFLASPYFNKGVQAPILIQFYSLILKHEANLEHPRLSKEAVTKHLFGVASPDKKSLHQLDKLGTGLLDLTEQYLAQKEYEARQSPAKKLLATMKFFRKHQQDQRFWQAKEAAFKALESSSWRDSWYFFDAFELHGEVTNMSTPIASLKKDLGIDLADQAIDKFFVATKLEIAITQQFQAQNFNATHQYTSLLKAIRDWVVAKAETRPAIIELQMEILNMFETPPSIEEALALEQKISQNKVLFPYELAQFLYTCSRSIITRAGGHTHESLDIRMAIFQISKRHLEEGFLLFDGKISTNTLRILLSISLSIGNTTWAKKLLEDFPPGRLMGTKYPKEFCQLNWAYYYFFLKDYENAEKHLQFSNFENPLFGLFADVQLIKIYYETNNELLDARMKALDQKIRRSTQTESWKLQISNFLKFLEKLVRLQGFKEPAVHTSLLETIETTPAVYHKDWLLEKLSALP